MEIQRLNLYEGIENMNLDKKNVLESTNQLQQHDSDALIQEEQQRLNMSKRE
jgi:hypothetical protein